MAGGGGYIAYPAERGYHIVYLGTDGRPTGAYAPAEYVAVVYAHGAAAVLGPLGIA